MKFNAMPQKKPRKKIKTYAGKNIRFSDDAFKLLKVFTDEKGYRLGSFCEIAALEKMKSESINNL